MGHEKFTRMELAHYQYIQHINGPEHPVLREVREETARMPEAEMQIAPDQAQFMQLQLHMLGAERVLEIGAFTGYSALAMALALPERGKVVTLDQSEEWTDRARVFWNKAGLTDRIELRLGMASRTLVNMIEKEHLTGSFDAAFIDADKEHYEYYFERCMDLVKPGGLIMIDNAFRGGAALEPEEKWDKGTRAIVELERKLTVDGRVWISTIPVGDGLTLALKKLQ